jgi:hypothetical protein
VKNHLKMKRFLRVRKQYKTAKLRQMASHLRAQKR